ncbi:MAG: RNA polymerase sigma factor FliA [Gammaproteobacteria bacterium]|nr:RNA polymerase sigma factor FliA [Gammaproteobacteria bacterium]
MDPTAVYTEAVKQLDHEKIEKSIPLVKRIALHMKARLPDHIELDDLEQSGMVGLIDAARNYVSGKGASFETYAGTRIKGAMIDELRRLSWAPRSVYSKVREINEAIQAVESRENRAGTDREIAEFLNVPIEEYQAALAATAGCQLLFMEDRPEEVEEQTASEHLNPVDILQDDSFRDLLALEIDSLPEKENLVMALYYQEEMNLKEIGKILEVSESRISQIHSQALARLRSKMSDWVKES